MYVIWRIVKAKKAARGEQNTGSKVKKEMFGLVPFVTTKLNHPVNSKALTSNSSMRLQSVAKEWSILIFRTKNYSRIVLFVTAS